MHRPQTEPAPGGRIRARPARRQPARRRRWLPPILKPIDLRGETINHGPVAELLKKSHFVRVSPYQVPIKPLFLL